MSPSTMELFVANGFAPIEVDGKIVHPMFRHAVAAGDRIRIAWRSSKSERVQGLGVRLRVPGQPGRRGEGGLLRIDPIESPAFLLWTDTAPPVVEIECIRVDPAAELRVSNRWRLPNGREDEWLNNFGMIVEAVSDHSYLLHCNDGYGPKLTFDDLVVEISIER